MQYKTIKSNSLKSIALVAHDNMKQDLIEWCQTYKEKLSLHQLYATGTTGRVISQQTRLTITKLLSGPLGGDQQIGSLISEEKIDMLIFFWDPLEAQPHDPDVKALLRLAAVWNIPVASNLASAEFLINSRLFELDYERKVPDYNHYLSERT